MTLCGNSPTRPPSAIPRGYLGERRFIRHVTWFRGAVDNFHFFNLLVYPITDSEGAVAEVKAEGMPADYTISPDERWFVRDQQIFQSWTILVLYKIEADSRVRLVSDKLRDLGLDCVLADLHRKTKEWANISSKDFGHVAAENVSWSSDSNVIHFDLGARLNVQNPKSKTLEDVVRTVEYNINTGKTTVHSTN